MRTFVSAGISVVMGEKKRVYIINIYWNAWRSLIPHCKALFSGDDDKCCIELLFHCYHLGSKTWLLLSCT